LALCSINTKTNSNGKTFSREPARMDAKREEPAPSSQPLAASENQEQNQRQTVASNISALGP